MVVNTLSVLGNVFHGVPVDLCLTESDLDHVNFMDVLDPETNDPSGLVYGEVNPQQQGEEAEGKGENPFFKSALLRNHPEPQALRLLGDSAENGGWVVFDRKDPYLLSIDPDAVGRETAVVRGEGEQVLSVKVGKRGTSHTLPLANQDRERAAHIASRLNASFSGDRVSLAMRRDDISFQIFSVGPGILLGLLHFKDSNDFSIVMQGPQDLTWQSIGLKKLLKFEMSGGLPVELAVCVKEGQLEFTSGLIRYVIDTIVLNSDERILGLKEAVDKDVVLQATHLKTLRGAEVFGQGLAGFPNRNAMIASPTTLQTFLQTPGEK